MHAKSAITGARTRGMTMIEVLVAIVLLVLVFIFVAENMIASSWAESKSAQRSQDISAANYFMAVMEGDSNLWSGAYPDIPKDVCNNPMTPVNDLGPKGGGTWHTAPACNLEPPEAQAVQYQWFETQPNLNSAQLTVWVQSNENGRIDTYELRGFTHQTPTQVTLATPPPSPTPTPTPTPKPSPTATPSPTPTPSPTVKPSPTPTPTPKPSPTATPSPTPTPTATPLPI